MKKSIISAIAVVALLLTVAPSSQAALVNVFFDNGANVPGSSNTAIPYAHLTRDATWDVTATAESGLGGIGAAVMEVRMITIGYAAGSDSAATVAGGLGIAAQDSGGLNAWFSNNQALVLQLKFYSDLGKTTEIPGVTSTFDSVTSRYWNSDYALNAYAGSGALTWLDNAPAGLGNEDYLNVAPNYLWGEVQDDSASYVSEKDLTVGAPIVGYNTINSSGAVSFGGGDTFWLRRENLNGAADGAYQLGAVSFDVVPEPATLGLFGLLGGGMLWIRKRFTI